MAKSFSEWTVDDARKAIADTIDATVGTDAFETNKLYVEEGDHWQKGDGWVGPDGGVKDSAARAIVLAGVESQFTPVDVLTEVLDRCANGLMQREPDVSFEAIEPAEKGSDAEKAQIERAEAMRRSVARWWDKKKLWAKAREALKRSRWAGRGALRLWIPNGRLDGEGNVAALPTNLEVDDALDLIELDAPLPDAVAIVVDPDTHERAAIVHYETVGEDGAKQTVFELWYVEDEKTIVRVLDDSDNPEEFPPLELGGRLPVSEMEAPVLITGSVRKQQARLNFAESLLVRVAETGGFPERYTLNAAPHGIWLDALPVGTAPLDQKQFGDKTYYLHSLPRTLGSSITHDLTGIVTHTDDEGRETIATPGVVFKDPTDPEYAIKSALHSRRTILQQCKQGHVAIDGTNEASGTAYQQARADFESDLHGVKGPLENLVRETIETGVAWAEMMGSEKGFLDEYRCVVNLNVTSGPITPFEMEQNNGNVKAGTLSAESAMAANGVEDVQSELDRMRSEPDAVITLRTKQITAMQTMVSEGVTWQLAAKIVGVTDPELLKLYAQADKEAQAAKEQKDAQDDEIEDALTKERELVDA